MRRFLALLASSIAVLGWWTGLSAATPEPGIYCFVIGAADTPPGRLLDANRLARDFEKAITQTFPGARVQLLTSDSATKPTRDSVAHILNETIRTIPRYSTVVFYFAGHGFVQENPSGYDADLHLLLDRPEGASDLTHSLPVADLVDRLSRTKMVNGVIVLDCCHAASLAAQGSITQRLVEGMAHGPGVGNRFVFLAAAAKEQKAFAGKFTRRLVAALNSRPQNSVCFKLENIMAQVAADFRADPDDKGTQMPVMTPWKPDWCMTSFGKPSTFLIFSPKDGFNGSCTVDIGAETSMDVHFSLAPGYAMSLVPKSGPLKIRVNHEGRLTEFVLGPADLAQDVVLIEVGPGHLGRAGPAGPSAPRATIAAMAAAAEDAAGIEPQTAEFFVQSARGWAGEGADDKERMQALALYARAAKVATGDDFAAARAVLAADATERWKALGSLAGVREQLAAIDDVRRFHGPHTSAVLLERLAESTRDEEALGYLAYAALGDAVRLNDRTGIGRYCGVLAPILRARSDPESERLLGEVEAVRLGEKAGGGWRDISMTDWQLMARAGTERPVSIGVLHSLSGTMAISETSLRDAVLFAVDEINAQGGVLGRKIEPVVVDGASNWPLFAQKARYLLEDRKVAAAFGCWTSVARKSVLPVFEKNNGLLFYPVQYEGEEESQNVAYTAESVNQQATPAVDFYLAEGKRRFYLLGTDYVYPQSTNLVLIEYLLSKGVPLENIGGGFRRDQSGKIMSAGRYTPFGHDDYQQIVADIKQFAASGDACVISTLTGDTNVPFFNEYVASGLTAETCPVVSLSLSEDELSRLPAEHIAGQLGCWSYFQSIETPANRRFVADFRAWAAKSSLPGIAREGRVTSAPMALSYIGVHLWKAAVEKAGSFDVDKVRAAWKSGITFDGPGGKVTTQANMHLTKNVFIGETKADGQFRILKTLDSVYGEPWLKGKFK